MRRRQSGATSSNERSTSFAGHTCSSHRSIQPRKSADNGATRWRGQWHERDLSPSPTPSLSPSLSLTPTLVLTRDEVVEFRTLVERTVALYEPDFESGFVAESPAKLRRLPQYYAALGGDGPFPPVRCNAPWVSVVLEADGAVRPCFFHPAVGNVRHAPLADLVTRNLRAFRSTLDVDSDPTCSRCVCSLNAGWRRSPWTS